MTHSPIYLDHNATTSIRPEVVAAMLDCYQSNYMNPSSQHQSGQRARRVLDDARDQIGILLGAQMTGPERDRLIITSGGTEANNLAIRGLVSQHVGNLVISSLEHPCVSATAEELTTGDLELRRLPATHDGRILASAAESLIDDDTVLASAMLANHETGVLQPVAEIAVTCRRTNTILHSDVVQAVGKIPVDFGQLGIDAMTVSAHKFGGPRGVGALVVRHGVTLRPILQGGFQQLGMRPGTESVALTVGMKVALEKATGDVRSWGRRGTLLREQFEGRLLSELGDLVVQGAACDRLPQTSCISFLGVDRQALMMALDMSGIACSTGSACASGSSEPSPVLLAMSCSEGETASAIRFSLGVQNTDAEIDLATNRIINVVNNLRRRR